MCLSVLKHASAEYATNALSSKKDYEKLAAVIHVLQTTHNLVISRSCSARAQLLFCSLKLLLGDVLVAVAVVF